MTIFTLTSSCPIPLCAPCKIPHLTRRTPMSSAVSHNFSQLSTLRRDDLTVGQKVSLDHMFRPLLDAYHKLRARNHLLCISPVEFGYKREVYDISDAVATLPASELSNFWEESRIKLHFSNQHSDKDADSKDDSGKSCPEREIVPSPEGEENITSPERE